MHDPQATSFNYYCVKIKVYRIVSHMSAWYIKSFTNA